MRRNIKLFMHKKVWKWCKVWYLDNEFCSLLEPLPIDFLSTNYKYGDKTKIYIQKYGLEALTKV